MGMFRASLRNARCPSHQWKRAVAVKLLCSCGEPRQKVRSSSGVKWYYERQSGIVTNQETDERRRYCVTHKRGDRRRHEDRREAKERINFWVAICTQALRLMCLCKYYVRERGRSRGDEQGGQADGGDKHLHIF